MAFTKITGPGIHTLSNIMSHNVKSSGIITAVNGNLTGWLAVGSTASFGGDVSIGGTLTYDDVTNVEAIGIITAKGGLHVGAAGTIIHALSKDDGSVGIGTTVMGAGGRSLTLAGATNATITIRSGTNNNGNIYFADGTTGSAQYMGMIEYNQQHNRMSFHTNGDTSNPKLRIMSDGKIGIGTDDPDGKLDVRGTIFVNGDGTGGRIFASGGSLSLTDGNGRQTFRIDDPGSGNTHTHVFNSDGRLGIGTDGPDDKLSIHSAPNSLVLGAKDTTRRNHIFQLLANNSAGDGELRLYRNSGSGTHEKTVEIASSGNSYLQAQGGNLGIGTASPNSIIQAYGNNSGTGYYFRNTHTTSGFGVRIEGGGTTADRYSLAVFNAAGEEAFRVNANKRVGIGTMIPDMTLHVRSDSDDVARFQSINAGNGPAITLDHIGGSPADDDIVGKIVFNGQDDGYNSLTYADIRCITSDVSDGSETAHLDFGTRALSAFNPILRLSARSTASAPSYTTDDMNGIILDTYNAGGGSGYERFFSFIAKSAGDTNSNIAFWTESTGGSPTEKLRITSTGQIRKAQGANVTTLKTYNSNSDAFWFDHYQYQTSGTYQRYTDIVSVGDGTWGSNIRFFTNANGSANTFERLRIKSDGNIVIPSSTTGGRLGIGLDGTPSAKLDIANDSATGQLHIKHGWASRRFFSISIINNEARWYKIVNYQAGNMLVGSLQIYTSRGGGFNQTKGYNEWKVSYGGFSDSIYGTAAENTSFQSGTGNSVDLVKGDSPENIYIKVPGSIYSGSVYFIFEGIAANWQLDADTYLTSAP